MLLSRQNSALCGLCGGSGGVAVSSFVKFRQHAHRHLMEIFCLRKLVHEEADEIEWTKLDQWVKFILKVKEHNSIAFNKMQ